MKIVLKKPFIEIKVSPVTYMKFPKTSNSKMENNMKIKIPD